MTNGMNMKCSSLDAPTKAMVKDVSFHDLDKVKDICIKRKFYGFTWNSKTNEVSFKEGPREKLIDSRKESLNQTTFIAPSNQDISIKGEGLPVHNNPLIKGDLIVYLNIKFPDKLTDIQQKHIRKVFDIQEKIIYSRRLCIYA